MASKNTSIALGPDLEGYARRKVASGEFGSVSEVIRDALRLHEERTTRVERLRQLIREGEESGEPQPFDLNQFLVEMHAQPRKDAA